MESSAQSLTIRQVVDAYLLHAKREICAQAFVDRERELRKFSTAYGARGVDECKPADVVLFLDANISWRADWTRKRVNTAIQACFNWAARLRMIAYNPFVGVSCRTGKWGRPIEEHEFRALLRSTSAVFRRVLLFLYFTGARPCELIRLQWRYLRCNQTIAVIPPELHKTGRRTGEPRLIAFPPAVQKLVAWIKHNQRPGSEFVFLNAEDAPWKPSAVKCRMKRLKRKLKLPKDCKLYGTRHALAANALLSGLGIETVSKLLGHRNLRTTQRYCHLEGNARHLVDAIGKVDHRRFTGTDLVG